MALLTDLGILSVLRWIHFLAGVTWIGLLYYFNFVQGPFFAETDATTRSNATQKLVPRALWWFRWGAMLTFLSGLAILAMRKASWNDAWGITILTGAAFVVIASAVAAAGGGQANPKAAAAARRAFLASRTNTVMSFPMLFFMGAASHFTLNPARNAGLWGVVLLVILALLELNALVGTTGPSKKPIETVRGVIVTGFVTALVVYLVAQAVLGPATT